MSNYTFFIATLSYNLDTIPLELRSACLIKALK